MSYGRIVDAFIANKRSKAGKRDSKVEKQVTTVKGNTLSNVPLTPSLITPALVLDDSCVSVRRLSRHVMGRVKDLNFIPNLRTLLTKEGFSDVKLTYLGGMWAVIHDVVSDERVVWVDIEGVPLNVWSRETFLKIGKKWGETIDIEENLISSFARKRLCIKTKQADNILEKFKVILKESCEKVVEQQSEDPFCIYDVLNKKPKGVAQDSDSYLSHPPGFTPEVSRQVNDHRGVDLNTETDKVNSPLVHTKVMNNSHDVHENVTSNEESAFNYSHNAHNGGSILEVLDDMIRVGQSIGYAMEGCMKDIEHIIGKQGVDAVTIFKKDYVTVSDKFIVIYGTWIPNNSKVLIVVIYAPQSLSHKRVLWDYISSLIARWNGETVVMGDFNEVRSIDERFGSMFNQYSSRHFNHFITSSGLVDVKLEGYSFTWAHPSATKMSKLDRFLVSEGIISLFPSITALCLDRHLSDHRPILLREIRTDYGPIPFRFYHSWFKWDGFDVMVEQAWNSFSHSDTNGLIRFKKKLQDLKKIIRSWIKDKKLQQSSAINSIKEDLIDIDKNLDSGNVSDEILLKRMELTRQLQDINQMKARDYVHKSKIKWAIEGNENLKFFHGTINKKCSQLSIRGVFVDGDWNTDPEVVKDVFKYHFATRFKQLAHGRLKLNISFPRLSTYQVADMDRSVYRDEIRVAIWNYGENKSLGPDGGSFSKGSNSSFIALIPKVTDVKFVTDFRPISLIGCVYKVVTKILANRLATVISDLVSDIQSAFVANRQILDGPFILNGLLAWCKRKRKQAMIFKVNFAKAYDSVCWDYHLDVLQAFGFGPNWCKATSDGLFKGIQIKGSMAISLLFYTDDAVFIGEWSDSNLDNIVKILKCFFLASRLKINIQKSQVLGVGVPRNIVNQEASLIGCAVMQNPFRYLGMMVGDSMSRKLAWVDTVQKSRSRGCGVFFLKMGLFGIVSIKLCTVLLLSYIQLISIRFGASILREMQVLISKGLDFVSHCSVTLSASKDRWICDLNDDCVFRVKEVRTILHDIFLPSAADATRWVKYIPIKLNVFAWLARLDRLPTRSNLVRKGVVLDSSLCPLCGLVPEDIHHVLFRYDTAKLVFRRICRCLVAPLGV
nr:RNA-directed DNA polymerase, eukaryota [Tanacetum cinerariifolium]